MLDNLNGNNGRSPLTFLERYQWPLKMFAYSRLLILIAMLGIAPFLPAPPGTAGADFSWNVFHAWDSVHYESIIMTGYEYANDGSIYNVAFPPLFSILTSIPMALGIPFNVAGTLVNNLGFLGALIFFYEWVLLLKKDIKTAELSVTLLAWFPLSLYGTVIYTEGIFFLFSIGALYFFEKKSYILAGIMGGLTTATRVIGLALLPTFWLATWIQKRDFKGYLTGIISCTGFIGYLIHFWLKFGDPLVFMKVQKVWYPEHLFWGQGWIDSITLMLLGTRIIHDGLPVNYSYILALLAVMAIASTLYFLREKIGTVIVFYGYCVLWIITWLIGGDPLLDFVIVFGSIALFWKTRKELGLVSVIYVVLSYLIILSTGRPGSAERYVYGIAPLSLSLSLFLMERPKLFRFVMLFFGLTLGIFSLHFAQDLWIA